MVWFGVTVVYGVFDVFGVSSVFDVWCELWTLPATGQQSQLHCTTGGGDAQCSMLSEVNQG